MAQIIDVNTLKTLVQYTMNTWSSAIETGDLPTIKAYLATGWSAETLLPSTEYQGNGGLTGLQLATSCGQLEVIKVLLDNGADVHASKAKFAYGEKPIALAAAIARNDIIELLLQRGASINHDKGYNQSALNNACRRGHLSTVQFLLDRGAEITENDMKISKMHVMVWQYLKAWQRKHQPAPAVEQQANNVPVQSQ